MKVAVIIPAFEPNWSLTAVVEGLRGEGLSRVIVVDDGSSAPARPVFEHLSAMPDCTLLGHERNKGKGAALKTAFGHVLSAMPEVEAVITVDADGQHAPEDCRRLVEALSAHGGRGYGLGVRSFSLESTPLRSWWGNRWSAFEFALLFGRWVPDTQTGLRAFARDLLPFFLAVPGEGYEYEMAALCMAARAGFDFHMVKIQTIYETGNASSHFSPLKDTLRIHRAMFSARVAYLPKKGLV